MDLALVVSSAAFITLLVLWFWKSSSNLPPGPWGLPLIGHLHLLAGMPPHRAFQRIAKKYGPITSLRLGMIPTVVISSQELAKEIFTTHDLNFASRPYLVSGDHFSYNFSGIGTSPYGELWRNTRKLCTMELFTAKCIDSFSWVRRDELSRTLEGILKDHGDDKPVEVRKVASVFSFNITSRILMSKRYFGDENVDAHAMEFKELNDKVLELAINPCISNLVPWYLRWLDWQIPRYKRIHAKQDEFLQKIVEEHKETTRECKDFLDIMLDFFGAGTQGETYVKANLIEMLMAGTDTITTVSEWLMGAVMHNPRVMAKLHEELDSVVGNTRMVQESDLQKLEYLQIVLKESLRRYPPGALLIPRISSQAATVGGFHVPKGTTLLVNAWAIGMDPAVWENPTQFHPERFLGSSIDVKGQNFELLPFGSGRRQCPGMGMGLRSVELLVANLIHGFDWSFVPGTTPSMEDVFFTTAQLKTPLQAMATPRLPKEVYIKV
ncbi:flavonoid 3'-monooxygenase [Selaginella moellendorffii]|uniref:Cytochrome P450-dependent monooxygenase n=2 Tax=Selaginella moellendorffii TaxID=88036 RepID=B2XCJ6_SELML|nr:flavonoid 3'-monooxygenase [Selaginella moellendorffii]ABV80355.1 cytochrome P450-dependent monooxygenase [Selaginella moellendorffii]|eukprot:XP_002968760.2 flavonoid 3'-monooxygenase [Selaginella moellendorffii]